MAAAPTGAVNFLFTQRPMLFLLVPFSLALMAIPLPVHAYLQFSQSGAGRAYVEVPDSPDFSVNTTGGLTIAAWMRPDTLTFRNTDGSGYVHWLGKGDPGPARVGVPDVQSRERGGAAESHPLLRVQSAGRVGDRELFSRSH